ncbi:MAG: hypothetical protein N2246_11005, partial [Candidatus Sumerlaeia bacterium]|nr:hypothetical protein [Candidatus Sumerlaeia bacterium]
LITLPLIIYALSSPEIFFMRSKAVAVTNIKDVLSNFGKVILMFGVHGDSWPVHNIPGRPMLFFPVFLCFVAGLKLVSGKYGRIFTKRKIFSCAVG